MSVIGSNILAGASGAGAAAAGYEIERSLRFNSADSASLSLASYSGSGTFSCWVKRCKLGFAQTIITNVAFAAGDTLNGSTAVFRDPSAWMHIVVSSGGTYVNGSSVGSGSAVAPSAIGSGCDLYLADVHFIDGQALAATDFGEYDDNNVWQPKAYSGTYGTNGFHLDFSDNSSAAALGTDTSGNSNTWTVNNLSVASGADNDSLIDTPMNYEAASGNNGGNYATLNPLDGSPTGLSNGNLDAASANAYPTIIPGSGQWYYEVNGTGYTWDGTRASFTPRAGSHNFGQRPFSGTPTAGHVSVCTQNLPDPTIADGSTAMDVVTWTGDSATRTLTGLNFEPDLIWAKVRNNTKNHVIQDSVRGFTTAKKLASNGTFVEGDASNLPDWAGYISGASSTGFTINKSGTGTDDWVHLNKSGNTYVGWTWDGGTSTVTNTDGNITSQVRANPTAGFSIVSYTGSSSGTTVGHGLNAAPEMIIVKDLDTAYNWQVNHIGLGADESLLLNTTAAAADFNAWNNTRPTSSVFSLGAGTLGVNKNGDDHIAYCFAPVDGYSIGFSFTGNGSADGSFVYLGFRPRLILLKCSSTTGNWTMLDTKREGYNVDNDPLYPNLSNAEGTTDLLDITSNGFKLRTTDASVNSSGATYVGFAWAENPFKNARAR